jgi:hypothetical protein
VKAKDQRWFQGGLFHRLETIICFRLDIQQPDHLRGEVFRLDTSVWFRLYIQ